MAQEDMMGRHGPLLRIIAVVFVGIHVPLVLAGLVWLWAGRSDPEALMLAVFLGTVGGLVLSVAGIWAVLRRAAPVAA